MHVFKSRTFMALPIFVSLLALSGAAWAKGDSVVAALGLGFREKFHVVKNGTCEAPDAFTVKDSMYCYYTVQPEPSEMIKAFPELMGGFRFIKLKEDDEGAQTAVQPVFARFDKNQNDYYKSINQEVPAQKRMIVSVYRVEISYGFFARPELRSSLQNLHRAIFLIRFQDDGGIVSNINSMRIEQSTVQELYVTPTGKELWHNRFGVMQIN